MNKKLLWGLVILLSAGLIWSIYQRVDWQVKRLDMGWMPEASRSPYLAAKLFLEQSGVANVELLRVSPSTNQIDQADAIFLPNASFLPLSSQHRAILDWVDRGGHLVVGTGNDEYPPLLDLLGFGTYFSELAIHEDGEDDTVKGDSNNDERSEKAKADDTEKSFAERLREENERLNEMTAGGLGENGVVCVAPAAQCNELIDPDFDQAKLTHLQFEGDTADLVIAFDVDRAISHPLINTKAEVVNETVRQSEPYSKADLFYWRGDDNGIRFSQVNYGRGMISVLVDPNIFHNANLGHFDHAYLLQLILSDHQNVLMLEGKHMAPLSTLLWRNYRETVFGLFLILVLGAWFLIPRFGAVRDIISYQRRSRDEGMRAIGQWYWRRGEFKLLVQPLRAEIHASATRRWPSFKRWPIDKQYRYIAEFCQLDEASIADVLDCESCSDEQRFIKIVKKLQHIRKCL